MQHVLHQHVFEVCQHACTICLLMGTSFMTSHSVHTLVTLLIGISLFSVMFLVRIKSGSICSCICNLARSKSFLYICKSSGICSRLPLAVASYVFSFTAATGNHHFCWNLCFSSIDHQVKGFKILPSKVTLRTLTLTLTLILDCSILAL